MEESIRKSKILIEALPYIQAFRGKVIVAKYGGSALDHVEAMRGILQDLVFLSAVGIHPVLVHGGGPAITRRLLAAGQRSEFIHGMRVTDKRAVRIVKRELELVNRALVQQIMALGGKAEGLCSRQKVVAARPHAQASQLGFVGRVEKIHTAPIRKVFARSAIPVISPIGTAGDTLYNINADQVASEVAAALKAVKLVLLTNVRGILTRSGDEDSRISHLSFQEAKRLKARAVIQGGMIPKVEACMAALRQGVKKTHVIHAGTPHAMLLEIFTKQGVGTEIVR